MVAMRDGNDNRKAYFFFGAVAGLNSSIMEPAGNLVDTFGFTILNVRPKEAGIYRCYHDGSDCGQRILYVQGEPQYPLPKTGSMRYA